MAVPDDLHGFADAPLLFKPVGLTCAPRFIAKVHMRGDFGMLVGVAALAALPLSAQREARMALPDDLAAHVERLSASTFGGRNEGDYTLADLAGEFTRIESRWADRKSVV